MLEHRLHETMELLRSLMHFAVLRGEAPNPEKYLSRIPSIDRAEMRKANLHDELDVYKHWYGEHIKWPEKCVCEREEVELGRMLGLLSPWEDGDVDWRDPSGAVGLSGPGVPRDRCGSHGRTARRLDAA